MVARFDCLDIIYLGLVQISATRVTEYAQMSYTK